MMRHILLYFLFLTLGVQVVKSQTCPPGGQLASPCFQVLRPVFPEQDCCGALPLCNEINFVPNARVFGPGCVNAELPGTGNTCLASNERRTTWYLFEVRPVLGGPTAPGSPAGLLRFLIFPNDIGDSLPENDNGVGGIGGLDYDFGLFEVTSFGQNRPAMCAAIKATTAVGTGGTIQRSCNYIGTPGPTGLLEPGAMDNGGNRYNRPLPVTVGQRFILVVDNFSNNDVGYKILFGGLVGPPGSPPSARVTPAPIDTIRVVEFATPECVDTIFTIKFSNPVVCDSVRADKFQVITSDPAITARINSVVPFEGCNADGQDTIYQMSVSPLIPGLTYKLFVRDEIKDICKNTVNLDSISFTLPVPDTIRIVGIDGAFPTCGNSVLRLKFNEPVLCDSIARPNKYSKLLIRSDQFPEGVVPINITRGSGVACTTGSEDTVFVVTFDRAAVDTTLRIVLQGTIRNRCGKPVALDSVPFRINPFLKITASPDTVCENALITLQAFPDSTFDVTPNENTFVYTWKELDFNMQTLRGIGETPFYEYSVGERQNSNFVSVTPSDLTRPTALNFRVTFLRPYNQCVDSIDVTVLASPKPKPEPVDRFALCFGESLPIRPVLASNLDEYDFIWTRRSLSRLDTVSTDSIYTVVNDDSLSFYGPAYRYSLEVKYKDELGGCRADAPVFFNVKAGKRIEPAIAYDTTVNVNGYIVPGFFRLVNNTVVIPASDSIRYIYNFQHEQLPGYRVLRNNRLPVDTTWDLPGNMTTTLTVIDSVGFGKICQQSAEIIITLKPFIIPNVVTLNNDGLNDSFKILALPNTFTLNIYNRWGKLVYESGEGTFNEWKPEDNNVGMYFYHLINKRDGKKLTGWFEVMKN